MADWIIEECMYPKCSNCGYVWITQCYGEYDKKHGNLVSAKYCPGCGEKIEKILDKREEK